MLINEILKSLEFCSMEELDMILCDAKQQYEAKEANRKKELWNKVVNAMQEYENEIADIVIDCDNYDAYLLIDNLFREGIISTKEIKD